MAVMTIREVVGELKVVSEQVLSLYEITQRAQNLINLNLDIKNMEGDFYNVLSLGRADRNFLKNILRDGYRTIKFVKENCKLKN